jgi:Tol biopolymer transport system component
MHYEHKDIGFSFDLPDEWQEKEHIIPLTFLSDWGGIQIQIGVPLDCFINPARREDYLKEPGSTTLQGKILGGESNSVAIQKGNEGCISAVHDNIHYIITYDNANNSEVQKAITQLLKSFQFPSKEGATNALASMGKGGVWNEILRARSSEEARQLLTAKGMPAVVERPGYSIHLSNQVIDEENFLLPSGTLDISCVVSPDATRLAYTVKEEDNAQHVEINGQRLRSYQAVSGITFSPDSKRLAYAACLDYKWFVVFVDISHLEERQYELWDDIGETSPVISPDSQHIAYTARAGTQYFTVFDGSRIGGPYAGFSSGGIIFSPDSRHMAYVVQQNNLWSAILIDITSATRKQHATFPTILQRSWAFSPDSDNIAYVACINGSFIQHSFVGEAALVMDGVEQTKWSHNETTRTGLSNEIYFSPDSRKIAYSVLQNGKFSFVIKEKENRLWVRNDFQQNKYDSLVSGWWYNPNCNRLPEYGKASWKSNSISFSPDSEHFAYACRKNRCFSSSQDLLIYDGEVKAKHHLITNLPIIFSHDSQRFAYGVEGSSKKQFLVVDEKKLQPCDGLPPIAPSFSPDSQHIAYIASNGCHYFLVVDSQLWQLDGCPVIGARLVWDNNSQLHTLIAKGRGIKVVSVIC